MHDRILLPEFLLKTINHVHAYNISELRSRLLTLSEIFLANETDRQTKHLAPIWAYIEWICFTQIDVIEGSHCFCCSVFTKPKGALFRVR